jgi:hypothetical protein
MSPRDFLDDNGVGMNMPAESTVSPRDFLADNETNEAPEKLSTSLGYAIPRIGTDVAQSLWNGIQSIPSYYEKAKTEIPGLFTPSKDPVHSLSQKIAGGAEALNNIRQFPKEISNYATNRLHLLPEKVNKLIEQYSPKDYSENINALFGQPQYPGEALSRGLVRSALPISGTAKLVRGLPHLTKRGATRTLNDARQLAKERDIGTINIDPQLIEDARQFLPNTLPERNALNASLGGDYNALFNLQSDVGKISAARMGKLKSMFAPETHLKGQAGLGARNRLLDAIHDELQAQGHNDISSLLRKGQNDYRRYMNFKSWRNRLGLAALAAGGISSNNPLAKTLRKFLFHNEQ